MFQAFLSKLKLLLNNPMVLFIYGILSKWYIMVMVTAIVVTFWVFKGLERTGILQASEQVVSKALSDTKSVAKNCTPLLNDFSALWSCLQNPPDYEADPEEKKFEQDLKSLLNFDNYNPQRDPYSEQNNQNDPPNPRNNNVNHIVIRQNANDRNANVNYPSDSESSSNSDYDSEYDSEVE